MQVIDDVMIALLFVSLVAGVGYFAYKFFGKVRNKLFILTSPFHCVKEGICEQKQRRRVSFEGEKVASRAVDNLVSISTNFYLIRDINIFLN